MIRSFVHIALSMLLLLAGMNYSLIQTHFYLNRAEIARKLCINEDKPELVCEGSCELARMLLEEKQRESEREENSLTEKHAPYYVAVPQGIVLADPECIFILNECRFPLMRTSVGAKFDFFHPPREGVMYLSQAFSA